MNEERLNQLPAIDYVGLIRVRRGDEVVAVVPNIPGKQKSLRLFNGLATTDAKLDRNGIAEALQIYGPQLIKETQENPGKHPAIEMLLATPEGESLDLEIITTPIPNVFEKLVSGKADASDKKVAMKLLEAGKIRTAEKINGVWQPQVYAIDAMNAHFSFPNVAMGNGFYDKVPLLTQEWTHEQFEAAGVRFIPGCFARAGAYIGKGTTLMPGSIVNTGAYIAGENVMIDGGARVATGAQVGKRVKLGAGSGLEGILEPKGMLPTILEDDVRVGANCEIKGIIGKGSIVASGVVMASGVKIYDERESEFLAPIAVQVGDKTLEMLYIPANRVAVPGIYMKSGALIGGTCIRLLEKPASETAFGQAEKHAQLYIKV